MEKSKEIGNYEKDDWDSKKRLGVIEMSPCNLMKNFEDHHMEGKTYDEIGNNCQKWVVLFLKRTSKSLVGKLPEQFKKTVVGKLKKFLKKLKKTQPKKIPKKIQFVDDDDEEGYLSF